MNKFKTLLSVLIMILLSASYISGESKMNEYLSLYDFNKSDEMNKYEWEGFTDQVMGGKSEIYTSLRNEDNEIFIRMEGDVSLENKGGFIQIQLKLADGLSTFKAAQYNGIRLQARGTGSDYYIFLRTSKTVFPWQFYKAELKVDSEWGTIDIPWNKFEKGDYGSCGKFNPDRLKSIALVAYGNEFQAEIDLKRIGLY